VTARDGKPGQGLAGAPDEPGPGAALAAPDPVRVASDAHDTAVARREPGYLDSTTGLFTFTSSYLAAQGTCCGNGCRHCPY
jgi:hypothetical protein